MKSEVKDELSTKSNIDFVIWVNTYYTKYSDYYYSKNINSRIYSLLTIHDEFIAKGHLHDCTFAPVNIEMPRRFITNCSDDNNCTVFELSGNKFVRDKKVFSGAVSQCIEWINNNKNNHE